MGKSIAIEQRTLGAILLAALVFQYFSFFSLSTIGSIAILVVALILILK
ncbi:MAG TPA: hypothetical protein HA360_02310 [Nanoarchaeota archaeon]|nr:hypothetical protein [Nanoarchaeota archaeon]HIJ04643.1 hypothetical protein [Nanoarchaeota archaeon]